MSNILPKDSSKVSYTQKLIVSKKFDSFAKITLRVTETGPSRIEKEKTRRYREMPRKLMTPSLNTISRVQTQENCFLRVHMYSIIGTDI